MLWLHGTIFLTILLKGHGEEEYCSADSTRVCEGRSKRNIYEKVSNERFQQYIRSIQHAQENYVGCDNKNCRCYEDVIRKSLKPFGTRGINERLINEAKARGTYYQIIDGKLYREKDCMFPSRCAGVEHFILKVISNLTDMELIINTRDYPQSSKHFGEPLPVFSFSKTPQYYDIMYPAWAFWEGGPAISLYPRGLGRWDQHRQSLRKASEKVAWDEKESKGFFRGSRTSPERDNLVLLSRSKPHLVDAQYTRNQGWKSPEDTLHAAPAPEVSLESHCKYKYLFNYRGVAASFRHKHLFLCRSLVFHVGNEWTEFYYDAMKPWVHYIPLSKEATKNHIEELIEFAKENDDLARGIANRGADFIWSKLRMSDVVCFWKHLLQSYAKLLTYMPVLQPDLIRIERK